MTRARVCILTSAHPVFDSRIFHKQARSLARHGYEVTLVGTSATPTKDESVDGVRVHVIPQPASRLRRMLLTTPRLLVEAVRRRADVYHFHDPELIPVGLILRLIGAAVIYDVHEEYPQQILAKTYLVAAVRPALARAFQWLEEFACRWFSAVIVATPAQVARLRRINPDTLCVRNLVDVDDFPVLQNPLSLVDRPQTAVCIGLLEANRGIREMVTAMSLLPARLNARLQLAGPFDRQLRDELVTLPGWERVDYLGQLDRMSVAALLDQARVGLALTYPQKQYLGCWPTKVFEYMAAAIPTVASDIPLWRELFGDIDCAVLVDPHDPAAIGSALQSLLEDSTAAVAMGRRGRSAAESRYSWAADEPKLLACYAAVLASARSSRRPDTDPMSLQSSVRKIREQPWP